MLSNFISTAAGRAAPPSSGASSSGSNRTTCCSQKIALFPPPRRRRQPLAAGVFRRPLRSKYFPADASPQALHRGRIPAAASRQAPNRPAALLPEVPTKSARRFRQNPLPRLRRTPPEGPAEILSPAASPPRGVTSPHGRARRCSGRGRRTCRPPRRCASRWACRHRGPPSTRCG